MKAAEQQTNDERKPDAHQNGSTVLRGGGITVSERRTEQLEKEWSDQIPDPEEELPEPYEETYHDGSAKNECWADK